MSKKNPGPVPLSEEIPVGKAKLVLEGMTTIQGLPFDEWLLDLTPEEVKLLMRPLKTLTPRQRKQTVLIDMAPDGAPKWVRIPLSLDSWKWTTQGWSVFNRLGQDVFESWASLQTQKLYEYKTLWMQRLHDLTKWTIGPNRARLERAQLNLAVKRLRLETEKDEKKVQKLKRQIEKLESGDFFYTGGTLHRGVVKGKDEFFVSWGVTWRQIPPALRDGRQTVMHGDQAAFLQRQEEALNGGEDIDFET